jgi:hypothetical protein
MNVTPSTVARVSAPAVVAGGADVLLIGGSFFGYAKEIIAQLERRGRKVLWFDDRPGTDPLTKGLLRVAPSLVASRTRKLEDQIIEQSRSEPIRDVLVIKGEALTPEGIARLRSALPEARFTLYFWDSYLNMPANSPEKVPHFDVAFTFDPVDARNDSRLRYRPLFFIEQFGRVPRVDADIDLLFVGTDHSDRLAVLRRVAAALPAGLNFVQILYSRSRLLHSLSRICIPRRWKRGGETFTFEPLTRDEIVDLLARARVVLDIERTVQRGFTMRTIELLGAGKKILTTNPHIVEADFFSPRNIAVIDRQRPMFPPDFMRSSYEPPDSRVTQRYALSAWLDEVLPTSRLP